MCRVRGCPKKLLGVKVVVRFGNQNRISRGRTVVHVKDVREGPNEIVVPRTSGTQLPLRVSCVPYLPPDPPHLEVFRNGLLRIPPSPIGPPDVRLHPGMRERCLDDLWSVRVHPLCDGGGRRVSDAQHEEELSENVLTSSQSENPEEQT